MFGKQLQKPRRNNERGSTLFYVAASLFVVMGMASLGIDLVTLYAARSEAQRAADAAALSGAKMFIRSGFTSGLVSQAVAQTLATQAAITVGAENSFGGQAAAIQSSDVTFDFSVPENPLITVVVQRTAARGNALPTFFAKAMSTRMLEADVSATATAEAFNPSGAICLFAPDVSNRGFCPIATQTLHTGGGPPVVRSTMSMRRRGILSTPAHIRAA